MKKGKRSNGDGYIQRSGSGKWQGVSYNIPNTRNCQKALNESD